jgi:hypothetical protein
MATRMTAHRRLSAARGTTVIYNNIHMVLHIWYSLLGLEEAWSRACVLDCDLVHVLQGDVALLW